MNWNPLMFTGVFNGIFFPIVVLILIKSVKGFDWKKRAISHLSRFSKVGKIFEVSLFLYVVFQFIFIVQLISFLNLQNIHLIFIPLLISFATGLLGSFVTAKRNELFHDYCIGICTISSLIGMAILSYFLFAANPILSIAEIGLLVAVAIFAGVPFIRARLFAVQQEYTLMIGILIWNCLNTVLFLKNKYFSRSLQILAPKNR